jgi:hypothetical protein
MRSSPYPLSTHHVLGALLFGCIAAQPAWSQVFIDSTPYGEPKPSYVCVSEQVIYDSNLFRLNRNVDPKLILGPDANRSDVIARTSACVDINREWGRQKVELAGAVDDNRFRHNGMLDHTSGNGKLLWDWQAGERWYGKLGANYQHALGTFQNDRPLEKDLVDSARYFTEVNRDFGPFLTLHVGGARTDTSHNALSRQIDNFRSTSADAGITLTSRAENYIGFNYQFSRADYPDPVIVNELPVDRDYREYTPLLRFKYALAPRTVLRGSGGYVWRDYPRAGESNYSGAQWRVFLTWQPTLETQLEFSGWQQLNAYFDSEADHFLSRGVSVAPSWNPYERFKLGAIFSWEKQKYLQRTLSLGIISPARDDKVSAAGVNAAYQPADWLDLGLSYRYERHDSTLTAFEFDDRVAAIQLRLKF